MTESFSPLDRDARMALRGIGPGITVPVKPLARKWGEWEFRSNLTLVNKADHDYEVDLERINSCAEMLDWIFHIQRRNSHRPGCAAAFLEALRAIFNPQANCCSWGESKAFSGTALARDYAKKLRAQRQPQP